MMKSIASALALLGTLALTAPASAQFSANSNVPTTIDADESRLENGVAVFSGQVDARQGDVRVLADEMRIYSGTNGIQAVGSRPNRVEAEGNFYYITTEQEVRGDRGVYTAVDDNFIITGNVILVQGENVVTGERLIYNLTSRTARVTSNCKGRKCGPRQRVSVLINNTQTDAPS